MEEGRWESGGWILCRTLAPSGRGALRSLFSTHRKPEGSGEADIKGGESSLRGSDLGEP